MRRGEEGKRRAEEGRGGEGRRMEMKGEVRGAGERRGEGREEESRAEEERR